MQRSNVRLRIWSLGSRFHAIENQHTIYGLWWGKWSSTGGIFSSIEQLTPHARVSWYANYNSKATKASTPQQRRNAANPRRRCCPFLCFSFWSGLSSYISSFLFRLFLRICLTTFRIVSAFISPSFFIFIYDLVRTRTTMQQTWLSIFLFGLFWSFIHAKCYYPDGSEMEAYYSPCDKMKEVSMCCGPGDECRPDGLCFSTSLGLFRDGCTDPSWKSSSCIKLCNTGLGMSIFSFDLK